ncbi:uncharacterized protein PFLUO_LOCUS7708 [Penicillium psychrofluorescens]|uniref:uncharacterized protein n=1 Tax=Penicillium psychrofluorescens TaxID=3158075 RepID=UPI003CCD3BCE
MASHLHQMYPKTPLRLALTLPGILHVEKSPSQIDAASFMHSFQVNTLGPMLLMKHLAPFLPTKSTRPFPTLPQSDDNNNSTSLSLPAYSIYATLAARVGSITDNASGGWYSYRASKAAVFQLTKTFDLYLRAQSRDRALAVALHPGTVRTDFTREYWGTREMLEPQDAAERLLDVLIGVSADFEGGRGRCWDWKGVEVCP